MATGAGPVHQRGEQDMRGAMVMTAVLWATAAGAVEVEERALAPEAQAPRTFVGLSVLPLGMGGALGLEGERAVGERVSVRLGVRAGASLGSQEFNGRGQGSSFQNFQLAATPGVRFFLTGRAPEGLWAGPNLELSRGWTKSEFDMANPDGTSGTFRTNTTSWGVGAELMLGYTLVLSQGLTVQAGVGLGGGWARSSPAGFGPLGAIIPTSDGTGALQSQAPSEDTYVDSWNFRERVSLAVGWAF
jgi:hypothetical protein